MLFISITFFLYNTLLEVLEYYYIVLKFLFDNFYSNLSELGIYHKILEDDNFPKNPEKVDTLKTKPKSLLGNFSNLFTIKKYSHSKNAKKKLKFQIKQKIKIKI